MKYVGLLDMRKARPIVFVIPLGVVNAEYS
jgi:hypothetical protein